MRKAVALAATAAALVLAAPAGAVTLQFTLSGSDTLSSTVPAPVEYASFRLDSNPTIAGGNVIAGESFGIENVAGTYRYGSATTTAPQQLTFYSTAQAGGFFVGNGSLLAFDGPQLYTGSEATPTFRTGTFVLTDFYSGSPITLVVAQAAAVPEMSTWLLMIGGFGCVGGMLRRRRVNVRFAHA